MHNNYEYEKVYGVIEVFSLRGGRWGVLSILGLFSRS